MKHVLILIFLVQTIVVQAQNIISPVRSQTTIYSKLPRQIEKWNDENNIEVRFYMLDNNVLEATVKLKMILEFSSNKIEAFLPTPFRISAGEEKVLAGDDLAPFFYTSNLNFKGFSFAKYQQNGYSLPDGNYTLRFEIYEYYSGAKVSRPEIPARFSFIAADPPLITAPNAGYDFYTDMPVEFFFRWNPRHLGASTEYPFTEYTLEIAQVPQNFSLDVEANFLTFPRIYEIKTENTFYYFDNSVSLLSSGNTYAYRVRARCYNGSAMELALKNNGYSPVRTFSLKERCIGVKDLKATPSEEEALIEWTPSPNATTVALYYRKGSGSSAGVSGSVSSGGSAGVSGGVSSGGSAGVSGGVGSGSSAGVSGGVSSGSSAGGSGGVGSGSSAGVSGGVGSGNGGGLYNGTAGGEWFSISVANSDISAQLRNLEPSTTYECKITASCAFSAPSESVNSPVITFKSLAPPNNDIPCGEMPKSIDISNDSLFMLRIFDHVTTSSGLKLVIEEVSGQNGIFSGSGYTYIPLLANTGIKVKFKKIHVNTKYELVRGEFIAETSRRKL
ncbi:MAG: fibronectin type III domain-containing protein [Bacteroidales bacterium]|jgi:hypothetical protein|nr:fibronectin type III domain-containing protein [Bacteroidales bacterium]